MKASWMKAFLAAAGVIAVGVSLTSFAQGTDDALRSDVDVSLSVANDNEIAGRLAPIKSAEDLNAYIAKMPAGDSPFNYLSASGRSRFISSLQFNDKGLASFSYADLQTELTPTQIYKLLSLFGVQRTVPLMKRARVVDETDKIIMSTPMVSQNVEINVSAGAPGLGADHDNYRCVGHGSCQRAMDMICTSNC